MKPSTVRYAGFTVLELLITVGAIVLVGAIVVSSLSVSRRSSRDTRRIEDIRQLRTALELYFDSNLRYPRTLGELATQFIPAVPRDPGGSPYTYVPLGTADLCGSYHLGANFETNHQALEGDIDAEPSESCVGGVQDFSGKGVITCGGTGGSDRCYDIVPEILALQEQGVKSPPGGGGPPPPPAGPAETYRFSGGSGSPTFIEAIIQPRVVNPNDSQSLSVRVSDPGGVLGVVAVTELDHSSKSVALQPTEGAQSGCTDCTWSATWVVNDSSQNTYHTIFTATNMVQQNNSVTLGWSNALHSPPLGGDWTLDCNCTNTGVDGVDNGNFTVASPYTLTLQAGSTWAINSDKSISFTGGTIAIGNDASIVFSNLYIKDADGDGYASSTAYQSTSQLAGYQRRSTRTGSTDMNDDLSTVYQSIACYRDDDADTYTTGGAVTVSCGASCGTGCTNFRTSANGSDCNDSNASFYQNLTGYTDSDGDGYGTGTNQNPCSGASLPSGYSSNNTDCSDVNGNVYQNVALLVTDADQDAYSTGSAGTQCVGGTTAVGGRTYYRATSGSYTWLGSGQSSGTDCNDSSATAWRNRYADTDGDGYGTASATCVGNDAGYVDNNTDCSTLDGTRWQNLTCYSDDDNDDYTDWQGTVCTGANCGLPNSAYQATSSGSDCYDANANARPGQISYFTANRGDGSFDYNCGGTEEKQYTGIGPSCSSSCCTTNSATSCTSSSYTANQPDNGNVVACGSTVTTYANAACGSAACGSSSVTQACR